MTSSHAILHVLFLFPTAITALQVSEPINHHTSAATRKCSKQKMVYHRDTMAPFGFGNQYNHFVAFVTMAILEDRVPVEEGPWTLGCPDSGLPSSGYYDANKGEFGKDEGYGFHQCYVSMQHFEASCKSSSSDAYREAWHSKVKDPSIHYDVKMLSDRAADEWHFDGDVVRWHMNQLEVDCPEESEDEAADAARCENRSGPSSDAAGSFWSYKPCRYTPVVRRLCEKTGQRTLSRLDLARYVTQEVVPFNGFHGMKHKCRESWNGKKTLAIHVRRTDKLNHEDKLYPVEQYISAAKKKGWTFDLVAIATDDQAAVREETEQLRKNPTADTQGLEYIMFDHKVNPAYYARYAAESNTQFIEELACLAEADFFVDSTKSNGGWLTQTLRSKSPETAIGMDGGELHMN